LFEALDRETRANEENNWVKEPVEGSAQLQAGAGNESGQETAFEEVTRSTLALLVSDLGGR
jgi:hypothetical protein